MISPNKGTAPKLTKNATMGMKKISAIPYSKFKMLPDIVLFRQRLTLY